MGREAFLCHPHNHFPTFCLSLPVSYTNQRDQMEKLFSNIWPFTTMKICPMAQKIPKIGSNFGRILIKPSKNYQRILKSGNLAKFC